MVIELHIWGPAFGLPSINAACLSAIVYLQQCLFDGDWILVPSSNPNISPYGELPALLDGTTWVAGFPAIVSYLQGRPSTHDPNADLTPKQHADLVAYTALILSRAQPLLDLLLYVSTENYNTATSPALGQILSWPYSWTIPHTLRAQAKTRAEHLNLSSLDVDAATEQERTREENKLTGQIPQILRRSRLTLGAALKDKQKTRFRLEGAVADFLEPLDDFLGKEQGWLLGTESPTSLDCLAIGYLTLMQSPHLPHPFLKVALKEKYPALGQWAQKHARLLYDPPDDISDFAHEPFATPAALPWSFPPRRSSLGLISDTTWATIYSIPFVNSLLQVTEVPKLPPSANRQTRQKALIRLHQQRSYQVRILFSSITSAAAIGWLWYTGYVTFLQPGRAVRVSRREFGAAGSMLGLR